MLLRQTEILSTIREDEGLHMPLKQNMLTRTIAHLVEKAIHMLRSPSEARVRVCFPVCNVLCNKAWQMAKINL